MIPVSSPQIADELLISASKNIMEDVGYWISHSRISWQSSGVAEILLKNYNLPYALDFFLL